MTTEQLRTLPASEATALQPLLLALWHDAQGDWDAAHHIAQEIDTPAGAWVHAYLHRHEGDDANAAFWYRQARQAIARGSFDAEWTAIVMALMKTG